MASIEARLLALENKQPKANLYALVLLIAGDITQAQQKQIAEAEHAGQEIILVKLIPL